MSITRRRVQPFALLLLILGSCSCRDASEQELRRIFRPFFEASDLESKRAALTSAEATAVDISMRCLREPSSDASRERERKMLHLLKALRYEINWGLTDAELMDVVKPSGAPTEIETEIGRLFDDSLVDRDLEVLNTLEPTDLVAFVTVAAEARIVKGGPLPQGAPNTTWAAKDLASVVYDLKLSQMAARSAAVKLLVEDGVVTLPEVTSASFIWSRAPSIPIRLPPLVWSGADIKEIEVAMNKATRERYAEALARAKARVGGGTQ